MRHIVAPALALALPLASPGSAATVRFSSYLGGTSGDYVAAAVAEPSGGFLLGGLTGSPDFPLLDALDTTVDTPGDGFLARFGADGKTLVQATFLGGTGTDKVTGLALASDGKIWVAGITRASDFPTANAFQPALAGRADAFVARLSADARTIEMSSFLGSSRDEQGVNLALDAAGDVYVLGTTNSTDFPVRGAFQATLNGSAYDLFLTKLDAATGTIVYSTYLGGMGNESSKGLVIGSGAEPILSGTTDSADFPLHRPLSGSLGGGSDAVVLRLAADGASLIFSTYHGGSDLEEGGGVALDSIGRILVVGSSESADLPLVAPVQTALLGPGDGFVARFEADGQSLSFSSFLGGTGYDGFTHAVVDSLDRIVALGGTDSTDYPVVNPVQPALVGTGAGDLAVARIRTDTFAIDFASYWGGSDYDASKVLVLRANDEILAGGETESAPWPVVNAFQPAHGGSITDGFFFGFGLCDVPKARICRLMARKTSFPEIELSWEEPADPEVLEYQVFSANALKIEPVSPVGIRGRGTAILRTITPPEPIATYRVAVAGTCGRAPF